MEIEKANIASVLTIDGEFALNGRKVMHITLRLIITRRLNYE